MYIHKTENHRGFICSNPNFHSLQEVIITCLACFLERDCPRDRVCGVMKKLSELLLYHSGFFCEEGERGFFFFFWSESNFYSYRTETFSLNVLNRCNLHSQLSQRWCWVLDLEYNHNFLKFPYLGNPESYQPNIRKTYQSNWFLEMTEICKIRKWSYTHAGKTEPLSLELVVTCRGAEYQNGRM